MLLGARIVLLFINSAVGSGKWSSWCINAMAVSSIEKMSSVVRSFVPAGHLKQNVKIHNDHHVEHANPSTHHATAGDFLVGICTVIERPCVTLSKARIKLFFKECTGLFLTVKWHKSFNETTWGMQMQAQCRFTCPMVRTYVTALHLCIR